MAEGNQAIELDLLWQALVIGLINEKPAPYWEANEPGDLFICRCMFAVGLHQALHLHLYIQAGS